MELDYYWLETFEMRRIWSARHVSERLCATLSFGFSVVKHRHRLNRLLDRLQLVYALLHCWTVPY